MIFKTADSLRKYLLRKTRKGTSLHRIQREEFQAAAVGTLSRIKNDPAYEPMHPELRTALHLGTYCSRCHRSVRAGHSRSARQPSPARRWWNGLSEEERERIFKKEGMK